MSLTHGAQPTQPVIGGRIEIGFWNSFKTSAYKPDPYKFLIIDAWPGRGQGQLMSYIL